LGYRSSWIDPLKRHSSYPEGDPGSRLQVCGSGEARAKDRNRSIDGYTFEGHSCIGHGPEDASDSPPRYNDVMTVLAPRSDASSRLVGYSMVAIVVALGAGGLWLGSWGVLLCVLFAIAIIGGGVVLQLACGLAAGACSTFLGLGMAIGSTAGRRFLGPGTSRPTFR
jgi:hypothetical protein